MKATVLFSLLLSIVFVAAAAAYGEDPDRHCVRTIFYTVTKYKTRYATSTKYKKTTTEIITDPPVTTTDLITTTIAQNFTQTITDPITTTETTTVPQNFTLTKSTTVFGNVTTTILGAPVTSTTLITTTVPQNYTLTKSTTVFGNVTKTVPITTTIPQNYTFTRTTTVFGNFTVTATVPSNWTTTAPSNYTQTSCKGTSSFGNVTLTQTTTVPQNLTVTRSTTLFGNITFTKTTSLPATTSIETTTVPQNITLTKSTTVTNNVTLTQTITTTLTTDVTLTPSSSSTSSSSSESSSSTTASSSASAPIATVCPQIKETLKFDDIETNYLTPLPLNYGGLNFSGSAGWQVFNTSSTNYHFLTKNATERHAYRSLSNVLLSQSYGFVAFGSGTFPLDIVSFYLYAWAHDGPASLIFTVTTDKMHDITPFAFPIKNGGVEGPVKIELTKLIGGFAKGVKEVQVAVWQRWDWDEGAPTEGDPARFTIDDLVVKCPK